MQECYGRIVVLDASGIGFVQEEGLFGYVYPFSAKDIKMISTDATPGYEKIDRLRNGSIVKFTLDDEGKVIEIRPLLFKKFSNWI